MIRKKSLITRSIFFKGLFFVFVVLSAPVFFSRAAEFKSLNFTNKSPLLDSAGGWSSSTNFGQINVVGQAISGQSTSSNFILQAGFAYFGKKDFVPFSQNWRWYNDEGVETPVEPLGGENVPLLEMADFEIVKLRFAVKDFGGAAGKNVKFRLQFSEYPNFSQEVMGVAEISSCVPNSLWCYADGGGIDNEPVSVKLLSDADVCGGGVGDGCGTHNESGVSSSTFSQKKNTTAEYEFTLKNELAVLGATYFFRIFDTVSGKPVAVSVGKSFPSITTKGPILTLTVSGLPAGIATEGVTTDISTTPQSITFGDLGVNLENEAAQRLTVNANNRQGYQIFIFQRQGLVGESEIAPVAAGNSSPDAWAIPPATAGAYGYHSGDDVLAGNSLRFAPDNTYAKLENTPKEIGFSAIAADNENFDMVFKTEVTNQQAAGLYSGSIVYILVPTY